MEKKNKGSKGLVILLIIFILISIGLGGYIYYDKVLTKDNKTSNDSITREDNNKNGNKELDINSRLVQSLYSSVSTIEENNTCRYGVYTNDDFNAENNTKEDQDIKMYLVGRQLGIEGKEYIRNLDSQLEKEIQEPYKSQYGIEITSYYMLSDEYSAYSKKYIENIYKKLFGKDAKLDTSIKIHMDHYNAKIYIYNEKLDKYVLYNGEAGGTCGPVEYKVKLTKAILENDEIKIFERQEGYASNDVEQEGKNYKKGDLVIDKKYVYTFKLENDGMYSFVSRAKEQ